MADCTYFPRGKDHVPGEKAFDLARSDINMTRGEARNTFSRRRGLRAMAAAAVCGAGLILASGPGLAESKKRRTIGLEIRKRKVIAAKKTIRVTEGEEVEIEWTTDETVGLHLHGYDIHATAKPGRTVPMTFQAHTAGRFPITAHGFGHVTMIYLEVYPR